MYSLVSVPFYDHVTQCYKKVIKLDKEPPQNSPLNQIIKKVGSIMSAPKKGMQIKQTAQPLFILFNGIFFDIFKSNLINY